MDSREAYIIERQEVPHLELHQAMVNDLKKFLRRDTSEIRDNVSMIRMRMTELSVIDAHDQFWTREEMRFMEMPNLRYILSLECTEEQRCAMILAEECGICWVDEILIASMGLTFVDHALEEHPNITKKYLRQAKETVGRELQITTRRLSREDGQKVVCLYLQDEFRKRYMPRLREVLGCIPLKKAR